MRPNEKMRMLATAALLTVTPLAGALAQDTGASFFVTSVGTGDGANLGGLEGADAHCQSLAEAAGVTGKTWRAYLSTSGDGAVNARDRIGAGTVGRTPRASRSRQASTSSTPSRTRSTRTRRSTRRATW